MLSKGLQHARKSCSNLCKGLSSIFWIFFTQKVYSKEPSHFNIRYIIILSTLGPVRCLNSWPLVFSRISYLFPFTSYLSVSFFWFIESLQSYLLVLFLSDQSCLCFSSRHRSFSFPGRISKIVSGQAGLILFVLPPLHCPIFSCRFFSLLLCYTACIPCAYAFHVTTRLYTIRLMLFMS